jgi:MFS family permease
VGDIIDRVFRLLRANPILLFGIAVLPSLVNSVLQRALGLSQAFDVNDFNAIFNSSGQVPVLPQRHAVDPVALVAVVIVVFVLSFAESAALTVAISQRYLGRPETVPDAYARGVQALPRLLLSAVVIVLLFIGAVIVVSIALAVLTAIGLRVVAVILGFVCFFVGLPWAFLSLAFVVPAIVIDGLGPIEGIRRSFGLIDKARLRTFGLYLLAGVIWIVVAVIFSVVFLAAFIAEPTTRAVLQTAADVASATFGSALLTGVIVLLYYDQRVRKEAFDLQLAAEALPREG